MASKLDASTWSSFTKKQGLDLDDDALLKAFAKFGKTDESKPEPRLDALKDVIDLINKQVVALAKRKKELGDKPFGLAKDKLHELLGQAETEQKEMRAAQASSGDEEADSPVLLTTKMLPLVRELRKGEARMQALISTAGKDTAVMISRRAIAPNRRKLMLDYLGIQGGAKHYAAECLFEAGALTFVMEGGGGGMAKRLRAALIAQLELRLKVRVRSDKGEVEEDGEDEGGEAQPGVQAQAQTAPPGRPASAEETAYTQRLLQVRDRLEQALRDQHPDATRLRAVMGFASEKAAGEDFVAATKALDQLAKLLDAPLAGANGDKPPSPAALAYAQRLPALQQRLAQAVADAHPEAGKLQALMKFAGDKAAADSHAAALQALDTLERLMSGPSADEKAAALASQQRAAEAAATIAASQTAGGVGVVEFAKMRLELKSARADFEAAVDNLKTAFELLLESEDFVDDPRSSDPETLQKIDTIAQRLPSFPALADSIDETIDAMASAGDPQQRRQQGEAALKQIAAFRTSIEGVPMLAEMESTDAGSFKIQSAMVSALDKLADALAA